MRKFKVIARDKGATFHHAYSYMWVATSRSKEVVGRNDSASMFVVRDRDWTYCTLNDGGWEKQGRRLLGLLEKKSFFTMVRRQGRVSTARTLQYVRAIKKRDLSNLTNIELAKLWEETWKRWHDMNLWGHIPNLADFEHFMLSKKINAFLERRVRRSVGLPSVPEIFAKLTTPLELSNLQKQDEDFLELLAWVQAKKPLRSLLRRSKQRLELYSRHRDFLKRLRRHAERYDWLQYHYDGPTILDSLYFLEALSSSERQGVKAKESLRAMGQERLELKHEQQRLVRALVLPKDELYWIEVAREFVYLKGLRKDAVFEGSRCLDGYMQEVARRLAISPLQARQVAIPEMSRVLRSGKVDENVLNKRIRSCVLYFDNGTSRITLGKEAEKLAKLVLQPKALKVSELKGMSAYPGKARGTVRVIIEASDMAKMKRGDILVSPATNPNLMPAIRQAGALVTDEGGVTCHAAIVSRELKIPCVIGTKVATQAFKDGDKVEVDANKGIVKKIK